MTREANLRRRISGQLATMRDAARRRLVESSLGDRVAERRRARAIAGSPYFDPEWYLAAHDDLVDVDPLTHYLLHGEGEGRDPGPEFDVKDYVWANPGATGRALTHFVLHAAPGQRPDHVVDMSQPVLSERWFDTPWYAARHPELDLAGLDDVSATAIAWRHYRHAGGEPGPFFDREDFEIRNGVDATPEPLVAWSARRETAVHPARVVARTSGDRRGPLVRPEIRPRTELAAVRVAAAIHAHHLDVLDELLERLEWIPGRLTVLVTTNDMDAIGHIDQRISAILGDVPRAVRFTPNAGRNFGPLLAGLDRDLREQDVVLHLHTKKSLASGAEQRGWRHHLVDGLLPSPAGVQAIVSALSASEAPVVAFDDAILAAPVRPIGLLHGTTWPGLPSFANHWLGNRGLGEQLFAGLGLDPDGAHGWLDYPVGGMFWARIDALTPLLDLSIQFPEFGEELGQTDRTLAHAVERTIPASARAAGFDVVELSADTGQWRLNWSDRNLGRVGDVEATAAHLDVLLDDADVVTVDLFDTLLLRPTTDPDGFFDLLAERLDDASLVTARRDAEHHLRTRREASGDPGLSEIRDAMVDRFAVAPTEADRLIDDELRIEHDLAIGRTWLIERLRRLRRERPDVRMLLVTDTTQPRPAIESLLDRIGANDLFDDLYVSNERGARKDSGALWERVEDAERPERLVHLGDNPMSDLQQASDRGHRWFQVPAPGELPAMGGVDLRRIGGTGVAGRRRATELLVGHGLAAVAAGTQRPDGERTRAVDARTFGYGVMGPMMTAFASWCLERARDLGIEIVVFGGRDGHVAHRIAEHIAPHVADAPSVSYLPISRRAALGAGLASPGGFDALLDAGGWEGPLGELLLTRGGWRVSDEAVANRIVTLPEDRSLVLSLVADADLEQHGRAELEGLLAALAAVAPGDGPIAFVELGYSGTILRSLRTVVDRDITGLFGVTTANVDDLADVHSCFALDARLGHGDLVYDRAKVWEIVCSRLTDQAARYHVGDDGTPVLETVPGTEPPDDVASIVRVVQQAAFEFVGAHLERFGPTWLGAPIDPPSVRRSFQTSVGRGVPDPADLFAGLTLDDGFRGHDRIDVVDP